MNRFKHLPKQGDLVVYYLALSLTHTDQLGIVMHVDEEKKIASVMWMDDGVPKFEQHNCDALIVVKDEQHANEIKRQRRFRCSEFK